MVEPLRPALLDGRAGATADVGEAAAAPAVLLSSPLPRRPGTDQLLPAPRGTVDCGGTSRAHHLQRRRDAGGSSAT